jgi:hypothetical protein
MKLQKRAAYRQSVGVFMILAIILGLLLPLTIGEFSFDSILPTTNQPDEFFQPELSRGQYTVVDPINIIESEDWANYAFITGTGTEVDPYIIEDVEINGDDFMFEAYSIESFGINIEDRGASYVIRECSISQFHVGIRTVTFSSSFSYSISNNIINHCGIGILTIGPNYTIDNNSISECRALPENSKWLGDNGDSENILIYGGAGIYAYFAHEGVFIEENYITNSDVGIGVDRVAVIKNNELENCGILFDQRRLLTYEVEGNTVNGLPFGFFINKTYEEDDPLVIDGDDQKYGQIVLAFCVNVVIQNVHIQNTTIGFLIFFNQNLTMQNLISQNCLLGMFIMDTGPVPNSNLTEYIRTKDIVFRDCGVGIQLEIRGFYEGAIYDVNITIREFTRNIYDVLLGSRSFSSITITVPINTTFYIDDHTYFQVLVLYNGNPCFISENITSHYLPYYSFLPFRAVELTVDELGTYEMFRREVIVSIGSEDYTIIQYNPYYNITVNVVELNPMDDPIKIPGYAGGIIGLGSLLGIVIIIFSLRNKWKKH